MKHKVTWIKDRLGNNYLGIKFDKTFVSKWVNQLESHINDDKIYNMFIDNQQNRDSNTYHLTLVNVMEISKAIDSLGMILFNKKIEAIFDMDITDLTFKGIGTQTREHNRTYYVVADSDMLDEIRKALGFNEKDLHITIGFDKKDVFGKPKDESTLINIESDLTRYIRKQLSENDDNWNFLKDATNFPDELLDSEDDIEIINQTDTLLTVKIGHSKIQFSYTDEFRVMTVSEY